MQVTDFTVQVRNKLYEVVGTIAPEYLRITCQDEVNSVGSWSLEIPTNHPLADDLADPGSGIVVTQIANDHVILSGPTTAINHTYSIQEPHGLLRVSGASDSQLLWDRLAYPDPPEPDARYQTEIFDTRTATCESLMHAYVRVNVGPDAPDPRREPALIMGVNGARGPTITKRVRFHKLGPFIQRIGTQAHLAFRVYHKDDGLRFETWERVDRSADINLSVGNNGLASVELALTPPGVTRTITGGAGPNEDRMWGVGNTDESVAAEFEWGRRIERFLDVRGVDDWDELSEVAHEPLYDEGSSGIQARAIPMDDTGLEYGTDWFLGDYINIWIGSNSYKCLITGVVLKADSSGTTLGMVLHDTASLRKRVFRNGLSGSRQEIVRDRFEVFEERVENLEVNSGNAVIRTWTGTAWPVRGGQPEPVIWTGPASAGDPTDAVLGDHRVIT